MLRLVLLLLLLLLLVGPAVASLSSTQNLTTVIQDILSPFPREQWGVDVWQWQPSQGRSGATASSTSGSFQHVLDLHAQKLFQPASNNKVLTTLVAGWTLGLGHQFNTSILYDTSSKLACLLPGADPSLTSATMVSQVNSILQAASTSAAAVSSSSSSSSTSQEKNWQGNHANDGYQEGDSGSPESTAWQVGVLVPFGYASDLPPYLPLSWAVGDTLYYYGAAPTAFIVDENVGFFYVSPGPSVGAPVNIRFSHPEWHYDMLLGLDVQATTLQGSGSANLQVLPGGNGKYVLLGTMPQHADEVRVVNAFPSIGSDAEALFAAYFGPNTQVNHQACLALTRSAASESSVYSSSSTRGTRSVLSAEVATLLNHTLHESDNLYAETFLKHVGARHATAGLTPDESGRAAVSKVLASDFNVDPTSFRQADGCGLSRENLVSPEALTQALRGCLLLPQDARYSRHASSSSSSPFSRFCLTYLQFLPLAGKSGTLKYRFRGTPAEGHVLAKTGTLTGVNALSGVLLRRDGQPSVVFSVLSNQSPRPSHEVRNTIDQIVVKLYNALM